MDIYAQKEGGQTLIEAIENTLEKHQFYKKSFNWEAPEDTGSWERLEKEFKRDNPSYTVFSTFGVIDVKPSLEITEEGYFYRLGIYIDGKKTDVRTLKMLL